MTVLDYMFVVSLALFVLWASYRIGRIRGREIERALKPKGAVCPCGHIWSAHKEGGKCQADERRENYLSDGTRRGHEWVRCTCTKYHGPTLVTDDFFDPGVTG